MKYPIGIQDFAKIITNDYVYFCKNHHQRLRLYRQNGFGLFACERGEYLFSEPPETVWKKPVGIDLGALFHGTQGTIQGLED